MKKRNNKFNLNGTLIRNIFIIISFNLIALGMILNRFIISIYGSLILMNVILHYIAFKKEDKNTSGSDWNP